MENAQNAAKKKKRKGDIKSKDNAIKCSIRYVCAVEYYHRTHVWNFFSSKYKKNKHMCIYYLLLILLLGEIDEIKFKRERKSSAASVRKKT